MTKAANKKQGKEKTKPTKKLKLNKQTVRDLDSAGEVKGGGQTQTCNSGQMYRCCANYFKTGGC
jgi:hypothetical protein